ncbi:MAG: hypothetical protein HYZ50_03260 [Deltaproteobacteria bacterium]|nr:hypothetical protein [Deltaproteobacteria bacterium]
MIEKIVACVGAYEDFFGDIATQSTANAIRDLDIALAGREPAPVELGSFGRHSTDKAARERNRARHRAT